MEKDMVLAKRIAKMREICCKYTAPVIESIANLFVPITHSGKDHHYED